MPEVWKPIPDFPGYEVSDLGNVRSLDRWPAYKDGRRRFLQGTTLKPGLWWGKTGRVIKKRGKSARRTVAIRNSSGRKVTCRVARLVLLAHVGPPPFPGADCRHLDDNSLNDQVSNLAWGTRADNADDKRRNGNSPSGEKHPASKLTDADVSGIRTALEAGTVQRVIADQYGVHPSVISKIASRKAWGHLQEGEN